MSSYKNFNHEHYIRIFNIMMEELKDIINNYEERYKICCNMISKCMGCNDNNILIKECKNCKKQFIYYINDNNDWRDDYCSDKCASEDTGQMSKKDEELIKYVQKLGIKINSINDDIKCANPNCNNLLSITQKRTALNRIRKNKKHEMKTCCCLKCSLELNK